MATTNISTEIVSITGVSAHGASDDFIVSAQKFVVASVPKELLKWAASLTTASSHGGNTSQGVNIVMPTATDSILDVSRNGFSATEVPYSMKGFIANTSSLNLATNTYPKYYLDNAVTDKGTIVIVKPIPTDSETARVLYVDYTKIDDDCDLRDAVVYRACSSEYSKLATAELPTVSIAAVPPDVPSLATVSFTQSNALSISATTPTAISLTSVSYTSVDSDVDASAPTVATAVVAAGGVFGASTAPAYSKPGHPTQVSFEDWWEAEEDSNPFGDNDPGVFGIAANAPSTPSLTSVIFTSIDSALDALAPVYTTATISSASTYTGSAPTFTKPSVAPNFAQVNTHLDTNEDVELAQVKIQEIGAQLNEYSANIQNEQAEFSKENVLYQSAIQESMQEVQIANQVNLAQAQSDLQAAISNKDRDQQRQLQNGVNDMQAIINDNNRKISLYQAEVQTYQADVSKQVQEYTQKLSRYQLEMSTSYQAWAKTESDNIQVFQADIQNELNEFNKENVSFQANMQEAMQEIQVANQVKLAQGQADLQVAIDNEQRSQERVLQTAVNDMQAIVADNQRKIAQYQAEASHYATEVNQYIQNYTSRLQKDTQDTQATIANNADLIGKYQSELQQYASEVQSEVSEYQSKLQKQQLIEKEADKYYQWSVNCVNMYIQNNSKMIAATMAGRSQAAQA